MPPQRDSDGERAMERGRIKKREGEREEGQSEKETQNRISERVRESKGEREVG